MRTYTIYDTKNNELPIAQFDKAIDCAKFLKITLESAYCLISRGAKRVKIVVDNF